MDLHIDWPNQIIGWIIGGFTTLTFLILGIPLQEQVKDLTYILRGTQPLHLRGNAYSLYQIRGERRTLGNKPVWEDLSSKFPVPTDGTAEEEYELDGELTLIGSRARFKGALSNIHGTRSWKAKVDGEGTYVAKDKQTVTGFIYIQCELEEVEPKRQDNLRPRWTATYIIGRNDDESMFDGHWILRNNNKPETLSFGVMKLNVMDSLA
jgi:hypothetical protein